MVPAMLVDDLFSSHRQTLLSPKRPTLPLADLLQSDEWQGSAKPESLGMHDMSGIYDLVQPYVSEAKPEHCDPVLLQDEQQIS